MRRRTRYTGLQTGDNMSQIPQRIAQRTSEIKSAYSANKVSSEKLKASIVKSLDSSTQNAKDLESAKKNGQITDPHYQSATFLNNINKVLNESLASADPKTLDSINQNLTDIKKLISDYTKATIDKQDTSISYVDPKRKSSEAKKESKIVKYVKDKATGVWDWLKDLFKGLIALLGIPLLIKAGKFLFKLGATLYKLGKGVIKTIVGVVNFARKWGPKVIEIVKSPIKWFTSTIWPAAWGLIKSQLAKIPILSKFLDDTNDVKKVSETAKTAKNAGVFGKIAGGINAAYQGGKKFIGDKFTAVGKFFDELKGKISQKILKEFPFISQYYDKFKSIASKGIQAVKEFFSKIYRLVKIAMDYGDKAGKVLGKYGKYAKPLASAIGKILKKGVARIAAFVASVAAGPVGWLISAIFIAWFVWDWAKFIYDNAISDTKYDILDPKLHLCAAVYAILGLDLLNNKDDADAWNAVEPLTPEEAGKLTNNLDRDTARKASQTQRENMRVQLEAEYAGYSNNFNRLYTHTIKYQDADGNLLSDEDSAQIQQLYLDRANLQSEKARLQAEYLDRLGNSKYYKGEVEISKDPEKFKELVNYFFDEYKNGNFWRDIWSSNDEANTKKEFHYLQYKKAMESGDIVEAAKEKAKSEIYELIAKLKELGYDDSEIEKRVLGANRYTNLDTKIGNINARLNENAASLDKFGSISEHSAIMKEGVSLTSASGLGTSRAVSAANYALSNAGSESKGLCATYVNSALREFYPGMGYGDGYQVGSLLSNIGWENAKPPYLVGDVAVFDKSSYTNSKYGHTAILTRNGWVSDFKQNQMSPYTGKGKEHLKRSYDFAAVYRDTGRTPLTPTIGKSASKVKGPSVRSSGVQTQTQVAPVVIAANQQKTPGPIDLTEYWELLPV